MTEGTGHVKTTVMKWLGGVLLGTLVGVALIASVVYYAYVRFFYESHTETRVSRFSQAVFFSRVVKNFEFYTYEINFKSGKEMIRCQSSLDKFWEIEYDRTKDVITSIFIFEGYLLRLQDDGRISWIQGTETVVDLDRSIFTKDFRLALAKRDQLHYVHAREIRDVEAKYVRQVEEEKREAGKYLAEIPDGLKLISPPIRSYEAPAPDSKESIAVPAPPMLAH